ncbi:hypothetical protein OKW38_001901 [Paraburkholderia sp. MM5496-R1]|uniref:hypothetical protein n=1 Tax=Paraburkholderia sp. MM5496-R1 TaxID=2991065 RepID=UPI003D1AC94C
MWRAIAVARSRSFSVPVEQASQRGGVYGGQHRSAGVGDVDVDQASMRGDRAHWNHHRVSVALIIFAFNSLAAQSSGCQPSVKNA